MIPIFLLAAIVVALAVAVIRLTDADIEPPFSLNTLVAVLGGLAVLLILYRIINPPGGADFGGVSVDITLKILDLRQPDRSRGGIAYGGYSAMREEGTTFGDAADRLSGRGGGGAAPGGGGGGHRPAAPAAAIAAAGGQRARAAAHRRPNSPLSSRLRHRDTLSSRRRHRPQQPYRRRQQPPPRRRPRQSRHHRRRPRHHRPAGSIAQTDRGRAGTA